VAAVSIAQRYPRPSPGKLPSSTQPEDLHWNLLDRKFNSVRINPFLRATCRWTGPSCVKLGYNITAESRLLDTYVSEPPCDTAWILATFYPSRSGSRIHPGWDSRIPTGLRCVYRIRSTKNLTIRRAIARPVDSTTVDVALYNTIPGPGSRRGMLGQIVRRL
jgi:hypothetical protein